MLIIILLGVSVIAIALLFIGKPLTGATPEIEAKKLVMKYDEDYKELTGDSLASRRYQLFHELSATLDLEKTTKSQKLPIWAFFAIAIALFSALATWLWQDGRTSFIVNSLNTQWQTQIDAVKLGDEKTLSSIKIVNLPVFCQLLQRQINREYSKQLQMLGECYSRGNQFSLAEPVYARLLMEQPDNPQIILMWAQTAIFANNDASFDPKIKNRLEALVSKNNDVMAKLLLAIGKTRAGDTESAIPLWQQLAIEMPKSHPLYHIVRQNIVAANLQQSNTSTVQIEINVSIPESILAVAGKEARLFIYTNQHDTPMPVAVVALPVKAQQSFTMTDTNSMQGETLSHFSRIILHAKLSADGTATGRTIAKASSGIINPKTAKPITLDLHP